jgi:hypothetical protein
MFVTSYSILAAQGTPSANAPAAQREDLAKDPGLVPGLVDASGVREVANRPVPADRKDVFVAVTGAEAQHETSATGLVVAAYGLFWLILFALVWLTYRSQERLKRRIVEVENMLAKRDLQS